jgi:hypothetical protein
LKERSIGVTDVEDGEVEGYCLEPICADFLAGGTEDASLEETLLAIQRLASLLPPKYLTRVAGQLQSYQSN